MATLLDALVTLTCSAVCCGGSPAADGWTPSWHACWQHHKTTNSTASPASSRPRTFSSCARQSGAPHPRPVQLARPSLGTAAATSPPCAARLPAPHLASCCNQPAAHPPTRPLTPARRECLLRDASLVELPAGFGGDTIVVGDIHGQFRDLQRILNTSEPPPRARWVFLGDYCDRSFCGLEVNRR